MAISLLICWLAQDPAQSQKIPLPDAVRHAPQFSPDGQWIYYFEDAARTEKYPKHSRLATLLRTSVDGKTVEKLLEVGDTLGELRWHPDQKRMLLIRRVDDTNKDEKIDYKDGDSLWMGELDCKNPQVLIAASPKKLDLYAVLPEEKLLLGYRDDADKPAKVVLRDAAGKEEPVCDASAYCFTGLSDDWVRMSESAVEKFFRFDRAKKEKLEALEAEHIVDPPRPAGGKLWYTRRIDSNKDGIFDGKDNTVLVACDDKGKNPADVTQGEERIFACGPVGASLLCVVVRDDGGDLVAITPEGRRTVLTTSKTPILDPAVSADGKRVVFAVVRDGNGDGKLRAWEDFSDLYILPTP